MKWRKSSRSNGTGGDCVEAATTMTWRKSSRSNATGGDCVEAATMAHTVAVRDSKNPERGRLTVGRRQWGSFTAAVRSGRF